MYVYVFDRMNLNFYRAAFKKGVPVQLRQVFKRHSREEVKAVDVLAYHVLHVPKFQEAHYGLMCECGSERVVVNKRALSILFPFLKLQV